jgi:hypothetical protein
MGVFETPFVSLLLSLLCIEQILLSDLFGADGFALSLISCGGSSGGGVFFSGSDVGSAAAVAFSFGKFSFLGVLLLGCLLFPRFFSSVSVKAESAFLTCFTSNGG